ncbi:vbcl-2b [Phascolarctid gammaherpesvirus 1]|uniref:Vbcl-2b n=1 Tax=Phascolarctid gammaherpesvirus 1 TaxID=2249313 RepID=A0A3Q8J4H0_9GAMA|nr:vbcl-2b [Phascolarctid gammaherpesvirus 1]AZB49183.1 vbcl-2b [Phascolarctid gammaherpesvirus 1]
MVKLSHNTMACPADHEFLWIQDMDGSTLKRLKRKFKYLVQTGPFLEEVLLCLLSKKPLSSLSAEQKVLTKLVRDALVNDPYGIARVAAVFSSRNMEDDIKELEDTIATLHSTHLSITDSEQVVLILTVLYMILVTRGHNLTAMAVTTGHMLASEYLQYHMQWLLDTGGLQGLIRREHWTLYLKYRLRDILCL